VKRLALLVGLALTALLPSTALAADNGTGTLSVTVPQAVTFTFDVATVNFGTVTPGSIDFGTSSHFLQYDISTNNPSGFTLNVTPTVPADVTFKIRKDDTAGSYSTLTNSALNGWRTLSTQGSLLDSKDFFKVTVPTTAPAATYQATLLYQAVGL
jgi:hypothetical protein